MATLYGVSSFLTFRSVPIPVRATINKAFIRFTAKASTPDVNTWDTVNVMITGHDVDNSSAPTTYTQARDAVRTDACQAWTSLANWTDDSTYDTTDIACVVQEIVDRSGWTDGNNMTLFVEEDNSTSYGGRRTTRRGYDYSSTPAKSAQLFVYWTLIETGTGGLRLGGTGSVTSGYSHTMTGGLTIGGTAGVSASATITGTGGLRLGGSAGVAFGYTQTGSGGILLGGTAGVSAAFTHIMTGGLKLNGYPYKYKTKITIPAHTTATDLANFPFVFTVGIDPTHSNGNDWTVQDPSRNTLPSHLRRWDALTGQLSVVAKVNITANADTDIWLYYGDQ